MGAEVWCDWSRLAAKVLANGDWCFWVGVLCMQGLKKVLGLASLILELERQRQA